MESSRRMAWSTTSASSQTAVRVSEIWDSMEQFQAFGERLMPILADIGIDAGRPETFEVYNSVSR
jgi:hypothetical protein